VASFLDQAVAQTPDGPVAHYEWGIPESRIRLYERPHLVPIPDAEITAVVPIGREAMDRKIAAIRAHETQLEFFLSLQEKFDYRETATPECFGLRRARMTRAPGRVADLWEGIDV
jgi:LmbE family N-acetylglucosaminyl deacetylase